MSLSEKQVEEYLDRIRLPQEVRALLQQGPNGPDALKAITKLQHCHLASIPLENLDLLYSSHHSLPADPYLVYEHVVEQRRGGTCDQIHVLFIKLVKYFGFAAYCTGSRINAAAGLLADPKMDKSKPSYGPWVHVSTIVTIGELDYIVDTSHPPSGSPFPVPLVQDEPSVDIWTRQRRMIYSSIPGGPNSNKWWRMQIRENEKDVWMDVWAFTETEWLDVDFQMLRLAYGTLGTGWATPRAFCFQTIFEDELPVGYIMLAEDELRKNYKGETKVIQRLYNENDRVAALSENFGIILSEQEQQEIIGLPSELKDENFDYYS